MRVLTANKKPISCLAYSPDGRQLAAASDGVVRIWSLTDGSVTASYDVPGMFPLQVKVAFHPDGKRIAVANESVELIGLKSGERAKLPGEESSFNGIAFSPNGQQLIAGGDHLLRWNVGNRKALPTPRLPRVAGAGMYTWPSATFSPDGSRVAVSRRAWCQLTNVNTTFALDAATLRPLASFDSTGHDTKRFRFSPNGNLLAAVCGPVLRVYDLSANTEAAALKVGKVHFMTAGFTRDGRFLATVSKDRTVRFFDTTTWAPTRTYDWDIGPLLELTLAPDGMTAAVGSATGQVLLFDID